MSDDAGSEEKFSIEEPVLTNIKKVDISAAAGDDEGEPDVPDAPEEKFKLKIPAPAPEISSGGRRSGSAAASDPTPADFEMNDEIAWKMIERYFLDEPQNLVKHHTESFSDFYKRGIFEIFRKKNPITIYSKLDPETKEYKNRVDLYFGGKNGDKIYIGKPTIYDNNNSHFMFPNEARLRDMTYGMAIHYDIEYEVTYTLEKNQQPHVFLGGKEIGGGNYYGGSSDEDDDDSGSDEEHLQFNVDYMDDKGTPSQPRQRTITGGSGRPKKIRVKGMEGVTPNVAAQMFEETEATMNGPTEQKSGIMTLPRILLGKFPIMLQSDFCILSGMSRENKFYMGECRNDYGGYFIIDGKEKVIIPQEKFGNNMMYVENTNDEKYLYLAKIRSVSENASKPVRTLKIGIVAPSSRYKNKQIVVEVPNVKKPVPLFILFRALGIESDKEIIEYCVLDIKKYDSMLDLFIPSVHDAASIMSQESAIEYLRTFVKGQNINTVLHVLSDYFLPHVGELNFKEKAFHLGHMVLQLMLVYSGISAPTDRDNFKFKRIETTGDLLYDLFNEYYTIQQKYISLEFEKKIYFSKGQYEDNLVDLIQHNYQSILKNRIVENGFHKAYKGNWGASAHTKRLGIVQDLNRLSYFSALNHMRKITLPLDTTSKVVGPRLLNSTQWGIIDPIDTPDGGNIGLHKHLTIGTSISRHIPRDDMVKWLNDNCHIENLTDISKERISRMSKVFVNGFWVGMVENPEDVVLKIRLFRRNGLIPTYISSTFEIKSNTIHIFCDSGRLCRPIFYRDEIRGKMSYMSSTSVIESIQMGGYTWDELTMGFMTNRAAAEEKDNKIVPGVGFHNYSDVFGLRSEGGDRYDERFYTEKSVIEYIDTNEEENTYIALSPDELTDKHTHVEIHKSLIFGLMCNMIVFPENNPATRNSFSCGQSKQACSLYSTNYPIRMDKMGVLLNYGQVPLVKTRYLDLVNHEENVYGENAIVAIMCYTGYNVEDAILINQGSIERGMFQTTYFTVYHSHEETAGVGGATTNIRIGNIEAKAGSIIGTKTGFDYSYLDEHGLVKPGTPMNDKRIVIGMTTPHPDKDNIFIDQSTVTKKGQLGVVDKTFITDNAEGQRIAKVRIVEQRSPGQGDKFAGRAGQKGTIGLIIPEQDMPFTRDGIRPDLIINPHAFPTRQTIGQLIEVLMGKASLIYGGFGDGTAFMNRGPKHGVYGELLVQKGFHSTGNEIMYNGMTGEQIESEIYIGPTYYMRLKHMVKDKINYRARGPRTALTRQPVQGRANDGGLRVGEMEANSIMGHGAMEFLNDAMMNRSDKYKLAICNKTGFIAVYNPARNLFLSPMADGPLKFTGNLEDELRLETVSRFGRDFSIVEVPYCFKLLIQELATINVHMRIITEDNIGQMENLMYGSKNIEKLTHLDDPTKISEIAQNIVKNDTEFIGKTLVKIIKEAAPEEPKVAVAEPSPEIAISTTKPLEEEVQSSPKSVTFSESSGEPSIVAETVTSSSSSQTGGAAAAPEEIKENDIVYLIGGGEQPWRVKTVKSDFLTIVNPESTTEEGSLKVVDKNQVYKGGSPNNTLIVGGGAPLAEMGAAPIQAQQSIPPMPQFNIKFVGGSDFSTAPAAGAGATITSPTAETNLENLIQSIPILGAVSAPAPAPAPASADSIKGGEKDSLNKGTFKVLKSE